MQREYIQNHEEGMEIKCRKQREIEGQAYQAFRARGGRDISDSDIELFWRHKI